MDETLEDSVDPLNENIPQMTSIHPTPQASSTPNLSPTRAGSSISSSQGQRKSVTNISNLSPTQTASTSSAQEHQKKSVTNISKSSEAPSSSKTKNKIDDRIEECLNQNVGELSR